MCRKLTLLFFFIFFTLLLTAQLSGIKYNKAYIELGGNGPLISANYERLLLKTMPVSFHIGAGVYGTDSYLTIPFGIRYLFKRNIQNIFVDAGIGITYTEADVYLYVIHEYRNGAPKIRKFNLMPNAGLRRYFKNNIMLRFSGAALINQHGVTPTIGFAFGKAF